jgi:hypothetical protein
LNRISIGPTIYGMKCTNSTSLNSQSWKTRKTPVKWRTKNGLNCVPFIYSFLASQPRNSIPSVTNPPAEKWVEDNFQKEVRSRVFLIFCYLQWNWVSHFLIEKWKRFFFILRLRNPSLTFFLTVFFYSMCFEDGHRCFCVA